MNSNPTAKRILCFGDSLTFGKVPGENKRYAPSQRWTGVLQNILGADYEIIEEGVRSRTVNADDPQLPGRNGLHAFRVALLTHLPLDLIIILLGTNDLKDRFNKSVSEIAAGFKDYQTPLKESCDYLDMPKPKILLLSPPIVLDSKIPQEWGFGKATIKSQQFPQEYQKVANEINATFLNLQELVHPSEVDGVHLDLEENEKLAKALLLKIKELPL